jgi:hypothetical protein
VRAWCIATFSPATGKVCTVAVNAVCQDGLSAVPNRYGEWPFAVSLILRQPIVGGETRTTGILSSRLSGDETARRRGEHSICFCSFVYKYPRSFDTPFNPERYKPISETHHGPALHWCNSHFRRNFVSNVDGRGQVAPHVTGSWNTLVATLAGASNHTNLRAFPVHPAPPVFRRGALAAEIHLPITRQLIRAARQESAWSDDCVRRGRSKFLSRRFFRYRP